MKVLIVAKTFMKESYCIGAYDLDNHINIRLLTSNEKNQPRDTKFQIGQIWDIDYVKRNNIILPHSEDVLVINLQYIRTQNNLNSFVIKEMPIWKGSPDKIFNGKINFPIGQSGYLEERNSNLIQSVGFWLPDQDIELTILDDNKHYMYFGEQVFSFPYVGTKDKLETIKQGHIIRVSLARWWSPDINKIPKRCYCQLSGWYDNE